MSKTTTPIHKPKPEDKWYPMLGFTVLAVAVAGLLIVGSMLGWPGSRHRAVAAPSATPHGEIGTALSITPIPSPTAVSEPLALRLELPALDPDQAYWFHRAQVVSLCPQCAGIDKPAIPMSKNAITVWLALIWTESRYQPWAVSSAGCQGLGQLCGALDTPDTEDDPVANLYASLKEWGRLLVANGGEIMESLKNYKGVTTADTEAQSNSVWSWIQIGDK